MKLCAIVVSLLIVGPFALAQRSNPGIKALVEKSTDIAIVEVLKTNPRRAMEGARDTVQLKVARALLGHLVPGKQFGVYYHLVWADEKKFVLEPPKFEKGRRYVVFLRSYWSDRGAEGKQIEYELMDQWLAVLPDRPALVRDIATAVQRLHGDSRGDWSAAVGPLKARLVAYRTEPSNGTPIITVYVDLRNVAGGDNTVEFNLDKASITWKVTDVSGKALAPISPPGSWLSVPPQKLLLEAGQSGRVRVSKTGAAIAKNRGGQLELGSDRVWVFKGSDENAYSLSGTINVQPTGVRGEWSGTINLPSVKIPIKPK